MVRQQVLVAVDADEVLERQRHAGLLVGLELREVHHEVGREHGLREQVLVAPVAVVRRGRVGIVICAAEALGVEAGFRKCAVRAEIDEPVATRIARQLVPLDDDVVVADHGFASQVDHLEFAPEALVVEAGERVEACGLADPLEVAVVLRCLRDRDGPLDAYGEKRVVGDGAEQCAVRDHGFDRRALAIRTGVPVSNEVGFEDDAAAAAHERAERIPVSGSEAIRVEPEAPKRRAHRCVDVIGRAVGVRVVEQVRELGQGFAGTVGRCEPAVVRLGARESDGYGVIRGHRRAAVR